MINFWFQNNFTEEDLFKHENGAEMLFNVMKAYAVCDPEVGYCQECWNICYNFRVICFDDLVEFPPGDNLIV